MIRPLAGCAAAAALAACAAQAPAPQPDVVVYIGPRDPTYEIPPHLRVPQQQRDVLMVQAARFHAEAEPVLRRISADPHFGGIVLRHEPEPHAIVMFTGDAQARLLRYTSDPRFRPKSVELTLAELERLKDDMTRQLAGLGLRCSMVDGDEEHNAVTVTVPDLQVVQRAIADGRVKPPRKFRLVQGACPELR